MTNIKKRYYFSLLFILLVNILPAQDITGTWEGDLGNDQFLQLNVIQNGDKICGYTRDYVKADQRSYCKAYFEGRYDKKKDMWIFEGTSFVENAGGHTLMRLHLTNRFIDNNDILEGFSLNTPSLLSLLFGNQADPLALNEDDSVYLKKVSDKPYEILEKMKDCFKKKHTSFDTTAKPNTAVKAADSMISKNPPVIKPKDSLTIPNQLVKRKNTEQSHIEVDVKNITLNVYDNAIVDDDTVSVFYNGKLLLSHQRLSEKPIVINLELDEKQTRQEIILFAENLGSIPPNTALVVIYAGDKRYELFASASLEENAVLVFDYRPK